MDRLTARTYPDGSSETLTYERLDQTQSTDRLGRVTRRFYDGFGRLIATRDPAARTVSFEWCACGLLEALIDAKDQRTSWELQSERIISDPLPHPFNAPRRAGFRRRASAPPNWPRRPVGRRCRWRNPRMCSH